MQMWFINGNPSGIPLRDFSKICSEYNFIIVQQNVGRIHYISNIFDKNDKNQL